MGNRGLDVVSPRRTFTSPGAHCSCRRPGRVFLDAAGHDPERPVRKRSLQLERLLRRRSHPGLDLLRRQDHGHRLGMDGADLGVRLRCQEGEEVVGGLALLDLPDRCPVGPDAGEAGERTRFIQREPDVAALGLVELAEGSFRQKIPGS